MTTNVSSRTSSLLFMANGHHSPRNQEGRAPARKTSDVMLLIHDALLVGDIASSRQFRKTFVKIDKQRWPRLLQLLHDSGFIISEKERGMKPGPRFEDDWVLDVALEPQLARAQDHPLGQSHVICTLCGNTKHIVESRDEAVKWYQTTHLKTSVGHQ